MLRVTIALGFALGLAACSNGSLYNESGYAGYSGYNTGHGVGYGNGVDPRSLANPVMPRALATLPPGAGPVVNVLEQRYANGVTQDIVLAGDVPTGGENKISVSLLSRQANSGDNLNPGILRLRKSQDAEIFQEISDQFPDVNMNLSQIVDRNAQGPFGYALGKRGRITCIYAWQWLEDGGGREKFFFDLSAGDSPSATLRVRLCKTGASEQALAGLVRQLVLAPGSGYGGYANAGYNSYQAGGYGGDDALTVAGHAGPVAQQRHQRQASLQGASRPLALYNTPVGYQGVSHQQEPAYRVHRASYNPKARRPHRVRARRYYQPPALRPYDGQTAAVPAPGPVTYTPAGAAQPPRYVPLGQATQGGAPGYGAVPLPE